VTFLGISAKHRRGHGEVGSFFIFMAISKIHLGPASRLEEGVSTRPYVALDYDDTVVEVREYFVRCTVNSLITVASY
jgi:hypothetical protein